MRSEEPGFISCSLKVSNGPRRALWMQACAAIVFAAAFASAAQDGHPGANLPESSKTKPSAQRVSSAATPGAGSSAEDQRKMQISNQSARLLAMAEALKAEVDKTNKDVLSINVIRKADEIERLAHDVKEKIKPTTGPG